jgi:hypothetical protein
VGVETLAAQRDEQVAGLQRAGVAVHALQRRGAVAHQRGAAGQQRVGLGQRHHRVGPPGDPCGAAPARFTSLSEEGARTPATSW